MAKFANILLASKVAACVAALEAVGHQAK